MAEIPVEKKSSSSWLWWLLLLLGVIALVWWLIAANDDDDVETAVNDDVATQTAPADGAMADGDMQANAAGQTTLTGLAGLANLGTMIGQDVELTGVPVNEVVSDEGFTVGEGANETLVMFDEAYTPNTPMEGGVDVNPGSNVTITGTVRDFPGDLPESVTREVDTDAAAMIFAREVRTVQ
ncbi:hypothetical protein [Aurantiacibacter spongiae]|uniref:Uncharacterized protein n=1 Tax=Aurantiacibacter spongiae TaxID=2488860 RepID=A0A3N5DAD6_9SPHN|nr:hypothetical protein [Aurantiacibacter spongiae]RPF71628.1 hypothetical protein EG799_08340 [Aurantiacibacter spongiae]